MSRATRPRSVLAAPLRERLLALLMSRRNLWATARMLKLTVPLLRRAVVGRALRPWQVRAVLLSLRGAR